jgi:ribose/xylose/arabinose/galactoside ABC-type transport system permease subunit
MNNIKISDYIKEYSIVIVLIILAIIFSLGNSAFIRTSNLITIFRQSSILGIASMGGMFVMISGGINLAIGGVISLVTVVTALLAADVGLNWVLAMLIAVLVATIISGFMGWVIEKTQIVAMIGTFAFNIIIAGMSYIICGGLPVYGIPAESKVLGQGFILGLPISILLFILIAALTAFIFNKTYFGRQYFASGSNDEAARLSGINTNKIRVIGYLISGALCGVAGIIMYGRVGSGQPSAGTGMEMDVLTATVIGGVSLAGGEGKVFKACCGVVLISMLTNGLTLMNIDEYVQMVIRGIIFVGAVIIDSYQHNKANAK